MVHKYIVCQYFFSGVFKKFFLHLSLKVFIRDSVFPSYGFALHFDVCSSGLFIYQVFSPSFFKNTVHTKTVLMDNTVKTNSTLFSLKGEFLGELRQNTTQKKMVSQTPPLLISSPPSTNLDHFKLRGFDSPSSPAVVIFFHFLLIPHHILSIY